MNDTERAELTSLVATLPALRSRLAAAVDVRRGIGAQRRAALAKLEACKLALEAARQELDTLERANAPALDRAHEAARAAAAEIATAERAEKRLAAADAPAQPASASLARRYGPPPAEASAPPAIPQPQEKTL